MRQKSIAVVVHACDRYELLYKGFAYFFSKHWPLDTTLSGYYFLTEEKDYKEGIFTNLKTGKGEWSDRLLRGLQQVPEDYVLYLQEDMWFNKTVPATILNQVVDFTLAEQPLLFKLNSSEVFKTHPTEQLFDGLRLSTLDNEKSEYLMSHQASVWNKKFLMEQLAPSEHPWRNERKGTKRLRKLNPKIYHLDLLAENGKPAINNNVSNSLRSEYRTISVNASLNEFAPPFIEELKKSGIRDCIAYADKLAYNYEHQLTHDGKEKPRKESMIKKLFRKFSSR